MRTRRSRPQGSSYPARQARWHGCRSLSLRESRSAQLLCPGFSAPGHVERMALAFEIIGTRTLLWLLCLGRLARHCSRFASGFTDHLRGPSLFTALASRSDRPTGQRRHDRNVTAWASWPHWNPVELRRTSTCGEIPGGELNAKSFRRPANEGDATNFGCNPATVVHVQMTRIPRAMSLISLPRARQLGAPGVPGTTAA